MRSSLALLLLTSPLTAAAQSPLPSAPTLSCGAFRAELQPSGAVGAVVFGARELYRSGPVAAPRFEIDGTSFAPDLAVDGPIWFGRLDRVATGLGADLEIQRTVAVDGDCGLSLTVVEDFELGASAPIARPVVYRAEVLRIPQRFDATMFLPRLDGQGQSIGAVHVPCAAYFVGPRPAREGCFDLALPLIDLPTADGRRVAVFTDPLASTVFELRQDGAELVVSVVWRYAADQVPLSSDRRRLFVHVHAGSPAGVIDRFTAAVAVAAKPAWLDDIHMVYFDYMSERGEGWFRDLEALAAMVPWARRGSVAVTLHGWYDRLGVYSFEPRTGGFHDRWVVQPGRYGDSLEMDLEQVRERLQFARSLGFRVLLYFADGTCIDTHSERGGDVPAELGFNSWNGPEVRGRLAVQNPADPQVRAWFHGYLQALLCELSGELDGLVWDETFWVKRGAIATQPRPAHADVAMLTLTRELTERVVAHDPRIAFLTSDTLGLAGVDAPASALMSHGTFQDAECEPRTWSYGLFSNWRKPLWSVLWGARSRFEDMRLGVLKFGAPVSLANGWADDWGPAEMEPEFRDRALGLFDWLAEGGRERRPPYLTVESRLYLQAPVVGDLFVSEWRVAGPFASLADDVLDRAFDPVSLGAAAGGSGWSTVLGDAGGVVDLASRWPPVDGFAAALAEADIVVDEALRADLLIGSSAGVRAWLNGAEVLHRHRHRHHRPGDDVVPGVPLVAGRNRLRLLLERAGAEWSFSVRFQDGEGRDLRAVAPVD